MCRKLIYLVSSILVLSVPSSVFADLVGHWTLDDGSGTTVSDSSGNGNDGTIVNNPTWIAGIAGGALEFHGLGAAGGGGDYVDCGNDASLDITGQISIALWIRPGADDPEGQGTETAPLAKADSGMSPSWSWQVRYGWGSSEPFMGFQFNATPRTWVYVGQNLERDEWCHVACSYDGTTIKCYLNGEETDSADMTDITSSSTPVLIGSDGWGCDWIGAIDDVRLYDHALSVPEILGAMEGEMSPQAWGPTPADGAMVEDTWASLSWKPGPFAVSHNVYLGDNFDDVNAGAEGVFQGNQAGTSLIVGFPGFPYPDGLIPGTTYYWRIDEVNDTDPNSPWKGNVWSFSIPPRTAYNPDPADGVKFVDQNVELNWTAGFGAKLHHLYFGDNFDDVNNATAGFPTAFNSYTPGTLELEKVYYWRVDEFDGIATYKGDVWSFSTIPIIAITDPSLVGWWKLDEDMGTTAVDWSGHGNHGTFEGDPQWVPGYDGAALELDGSNWVDYGTPPDLVITEAISITCWINPAELSGDRGFVALDGGYALKSSSDHLRFTTPGILDHDGLNTILETGTWQHIAATFQPEQSGGLVFYINGAETERMVSSALNAGTGSFLIGNNQWNQTYTGLIDNVRVYNKVLTQEEIALAMRGDPVLAWGPNPANGSTPYIRDATPLSWSPGDNASQHDVYFGTDRDAVVDADASDTTGIYRGRQGVTVYTPAEGVEWGGGPYYWRVDEYNTDATISTGNVWSFTVTDFIGIEDFEDYNDYEPDRIFETWIDGWGTTTNGSTVGYPDPNFDQGEHFVETNIVHGGSQSMPLFYDNNFKYSEATLTLVSARDWTEEGVGVLSLWFYGDAANAAERMYVALNGIATVYHGNPDAALIEEWTEWTIDLQEFAAQGVNLANVNTISIGFGDKNNLQAGGSGLVFFDDIRLYRPTP